jgi:hypothetical protein
MPFTTFRVLVVQATAFEIELLAFNATTEALAIPHEDVLPPPAGVCEPDGDCCGALVWLPEPDGDCCGTLVWLPEAGACEPQGHVLPTVRVLHATTAALPGQVWVGHVLLSAHPRTLSEVQHCA